MNSSSSRRHGRKKGGRRKKEGKRVLFRNCIREEEEEKEAYALFSVFGKFFRSQKQFSFVWRRRKIITIIAALI